MNTNIEYLQLIHTGGLTFNRIELRRGRVNALIAVGHSLLKCVYRVLTDESYKELGDLYIICKIKK